MIILFEIDLFFYLFLLEIDCLFDFDYQECPMRAAQTYCSPNMFDTRAPALAAGPLFTHDNLDTRQQSYALLTTVSFMLKGLKTLLHLCEEQSDAAILSIIVKF